MSRQLDWPAARSSLSPKAGLGRTHDDDDFSDLCVYVVFGPYTYICCELFTVLASDFDIYWLVPSRPFWLVEIYKRWNGVDILDKLKLTSEIRTPQYFRLFFSKNGQNTEGCI